MPNYFIHLASRIRRTLIGQAAPSWAGSAQRHAVP
jgi:hypothetical protein